ncbi:MAG: heme-dependent oxidative N-demethylase subunit alpha family protein [Polymorphobacter sp.]
MTDAPPRHGFSVAALAPFRGGRGALRLGLAALADDLWRDTGPGLAPRAAAKAAVFAAAPASLIVRPQAADAVAEVAALLGCPGGDLRAAALAAYEDLLVLLPMGDAHVLAAGALAFPTDWHLAAKIGRPLAAIHAPIPTYQARLSAGVDHVFATLAPGRLLIRSNWNVLESDCLRYLPDRPALARFGHVNAANAGETLFVRVERQVLRRLPQSGAALFSIGIYVEPLAALPRDLQADLAAAVWRVPEDEARRRGTPAYRDALSAFAGHRPCG